MSNFDSLKEVWNSQNIQPKYTSSDIEKMLHKKSSNYVRYILIISIIEFAIVFGSTIYYFFNNVGADSVIKYLEQLGVNVNESITTYYQNFYTIMNVTSVVMMAYFVYKFVCSLKKINVTSNLKDFIKQLKSFKNSVNQFILVSIGLMVFYICALFFMINSTLQNQGVVLKDEMLSIAILSVIMILVLSVGLLWLYYRLVYGILIRRLDKNLKELKKIEEEKNGLH